MTDNIDKLGSDVSKKVMRFADSLIEQHDLEDFERAMLMFSVAYSISASVIYSGMKFLEIDRNEMLSEYVKRLDELIQTLDEKGV